ncbi:MAG: hypothetical protein H3C36_10180 [Chitinophagaceae bacterium]|nr:hypothetical protein [Chitinophagaceae bacterium]MCW5913549.1 hypothetical protein [Chitinophagaceae bacterium]MCZ2395698.1 hypothetical protein [Chitinophagales bacterium]
MQDLEPFDNWHYLYLSEDDEQSPFYGREYSEFEFSNTIYNYYIHPLWDEFGSRTLYLKVLMADYELGYMIIEMIGEWNDAIENDIMTLKREVIDEFQQLGIRKFILIVENVLNFHSSDDSYYEEWFEESLDNDGWAVCLNMPVSSQHDFLQANLHRYIPLMEILNWRTMKPDMLFQQVDNYFHRRLNSDSSI